MGAAQGRDWGLRKGRGQSRGKRRQKKTCLRFDWCNKQLPNAASPDVSGEVAEAGQAKSPSCGCPWEGQGPPARVRRPPCPRSPAVVIEVDLASWCVWAANPGTLSGKVPQEAQLTRWEGTRVCLGCGDSTRCWCRRGPEQWPMPSYTHPSIHLSIIHPSVHHPSSIHPASVDREPDTQQGPGSATLRGATVRREGSDPDLCP